MGNSVVGLTLWPEDLRHLFSFPNCPRDFRSPAGVAAHHALAAIRFDGGADENLGAIEYVDDDRQVDALACKLQGQEAGFSQLQAIAINDAVGIGNITLYPKYQVLVANQASFDHLSGAQRQILARRGSGHRR